MKLILNRYTPNTIQIQDLVKNIQQGYILIQPSSLKDKFDDLLIKNNFYKCDILYIDDYVLPEIVRVVRKLSKKYNIESITTLCEEDMTVAGLLNDYFVSRNSVSSSNISFKDKYVMRSYLIDIVKQPYFRLITDIDDIRKFFEKSTVDTAIVKPRDSAGGAGVKKINRSEVVEEYFEERWLENYIIEERVSMSKMLTCDGYSIGSNIKRIFFHEYEELVLDSLIDGKPIVVHTHSAYFSNIKFLNMVKEEVKKILTHLTVTDELTPFHFEFFYDINSEKIVFCEVGKRFGGGKIPTLIQESFKINILEEYWQLLFSSDSDLISSNLLLPSKISTYYQAPRRDGEVKWVPNFENIPWITQFRCFVYKDEITNAAQSVVESTFYCIFISETLDEYSKNIRFVQEKQSKMYLDNIIQQ